MIPTKKAVEAFDYSQVDITITGDDLSACEPFYAISDTLFVFADGRDNTRLSDFAFCNGKDVWISPRTVEDYRRAKIVYQRLTQGDYKPKTVTVSTDTGILRFDLVNSKAFINGATGL